MAKILLVEDEEPLLEMMRDELSDEGHQVQSALNGEEALSILNEYTPDLILSDISMPIMDGFGLLNSVREAYPRLAETPIVFLTAFGTREDLLRGKKNGADDYLVKPVDFDMLFATIEARLNQVKRMVDHKESQFVKLYNTLAASATSQTPAQASDSQEDNEAASQENDEAILLEETKEVEEIYDIDVSEEIENEEEVCGIGVEITEYLKETKGKVKGIYFSFKDLALLLSKNKEYEGGYSKNINKEIREILEKEFESGIAIDDSKEGCLKLYFTSKEASEQIINIETLSLDVQERIYDKGVRDLILDLCNNRKISLNFKVTATSLEADMSSTNFSDSHKISETIMDKLCSLANNHDSLKKIIEQVRKNGNLREEFFKIRKAGLDNFLFFSYDQYSENMFNKVKPFMNCDFLKDFNYMKDRLFLEKLPKLLFQMDKKNVAVIDVAFNTLYDDKYAKNYINRLKNFVGKYNQPFAVNIYSFPNDVQGVVVRELLQRTGVKNILWLASLKPWSNESLLSPDLKIPNVVWDYFDLFGISSEADYLKDLRASYKKNGINLIARHIPSNADKGFLSGYEFDASSYKPR